MARVTVRVDDQIGQGKPALTEARVRVVLKDGRTLVKEAHGARGYPVNPANADELAAKFLACAAVILGEPRAREVQSFLRSLETAPSLTGLSI
jgi:2-methylcitrate dehydratase PrpD